MNDVSLSVPPEASGSTSARSVTVNGSHAASRPAGVHDGDPNAELEQIHHELVPLAVVLERVVGSAYTDLVNLVDVLPSMSDAKRKRAIVDYVLAARRELVKLLVLGRWSRHANSVLKGMSIINFLQTHNFMFEESIRDLQETTAMLSTARVRNYDLVTAIDVLTTGKYTRLPTSIRDDLASDERLTNAEVLETLHQLDDVIRYRLAVEDRLPQAMASYVVGDGRATFRTSVYEAAVTVGGETMEDRWYLLSYRALDDESEVATALQDRVVEIGNEVLAPREAEDKMQDAPLVRLHAFLRASDRLSLSRRLESAYLQAVRLSRLSWAGHLRVELAKEGDSLKLTYWSSPLPSQPGRPAPARTPSTITVTLEASPVASPIDRVLRTLSLHDSSVDEAELALTSRWTPPEGIAAEARGQDPTSEDLDVNDLLTSTIRRHSDVLLRRLLAELSNDSTFSFDVQPQLGADGDALVESLLVRCHTSCTVAISINERTGLIHLAIAGEEVATGFASRIQAVVAPVNEGRVPLQRALIQLRTYAVNAELESTVLYAGLETIHLPVPRQEDQSKLGQRLRHILHVRLPSSPRYYLALIIADAGLSFALIAYGTVADGIHRAVSIDDLVWIRPAEPLPSPLELSASTLVEMHTYCSARLAMLRVEDALHARRVPYRTAQRAPDADRLPNRTPATPQLVFSLSGLILGRSAKQLGGTCMVRIIARAEPRPCQIALGIRLKSSEAHAEVALPSEATRHPSGLITILLDDHHDLDPLDSLIELLSALAQHHESKSAQTTTAGSSL